ncbi:glycosyltransferase family 2 protein [Halorubrum sp. AJ67]|uniref:glycosyltransferase n=1 Tax=Halorubrum sp. AJ67 TaxID=1173487 RepID=UPI0003DDB9E5|nr:glycosyltransferase [Halorubrum sp. AJ67]CDK40709.1 glycosyl transferase family protein [Halorubrum sp. AJ67]
MLASVVIPTYNRSDKIGETIASVCDQSVSEYEVLLVDDGSTDPRYGALLNEIDEQYDRVKIIRQENSGPAAARNRGIEEAKSEFVCFTDDDCIVPEDWIERLVESFESGIGAVGGPLQPTEDAEERSPFAQLHRYRNQVVYDQPTEPTVGDTDLPMGGTANICYRLEALEAVDGFDEAFPTAAGEDADLQHRVAQEGWQMKFVPVVVHHNDEYSFTSFKERAIRHGKGTYYFHRKHGIPRSKLRVAISLLGSVVFLPKEVLQTRDLTLASLAVLERALSRYGELKARYNDDVAMNI